jgi:hypothetical protein
LEGTTQKKEAEEHWKRRQALLEKRVKKDDLRATTQKHQAFVQALGRSQYADEVERVEPTREEIATQRLKEREQYSETVKKTNMAVLPKSVKPKVVKEKEERLPPVAADLHDWGRRMGAEIRELHGLISTWEVEARPAVTADDVIARLEKEDARPAEDLPPDYHMQFAILFQKLENTEQKIKDLADRCGRFQ